MIFVAVACVYNIAGDLILVAGFRMDAAGAAIATVAAQAVSIVFALWMLMKKKLPFKITKADFKVNSQCKRALKWTSISASGMLDSDFIPCTLCICQPSGIRGFIWIWCCV